MTVDLDELERKAKWQRDECTAPITGVDPDDVLALIERVRTTETALKAIRDDGLSRDDARDEARKALE